MPKHFPPHQTTYAWFARFRDDGTWQTVNHHLLMLDRDARRCEATLTERSNGHGRQTTEAGGPRGYDAKKVKDVSAMPWLIPTAGRLAVPVRLKPTCRIATVRYPLLRTSRAAGSRSSSGSLLRLRLYCRRGRQRDIIVDIVRHTADRVGFRRAAARVVERFFAWINRQLAKFRRRTISATAFSARLLMR